jgi:hypothetical protein
MEFKHRLSDPEIEKTIPASLDYVEKYYRVKEAAKYHYFRLMQFRKEVSDIFSSEYLKEVYLTLIAWGMNSRGAKLADENTFISTIQSYSDSIEKLRYLRIESLSNSELENSLSIIGKLFRCMELVAEGKPPLVTFSKTMHFLIPDLFTPIDRTYTMCFFFGSTTLNNKMYRVDTFKSLFREFYEYSHKNYGLRVYIGDGWNGSIPKIMDNILIGYLSINNLKCAKRNKN